MWMAACHFWFLFLSYFWLISFEAKFFAAAFQKLDVPNIPVNLKVAFLGDQFVRNSNAPGKVLDLVREEKADMIVHLGDVGYSNKASTWCSFMKSHVSSVVPYFATPGEDREEVDQWFADDGYVDCLLSHNDAMEQYCSCQSDDCDRQHGVMQACVYNGILIIYSGYDIPISGEGSHPWSYENSEYLDFVEEALVAYEGVVEWKICVFHFTKGDFTVSGASVSGRHRLLDLCREHGALIVGGNSHTYSRTHLMTDYDEREFIVTSATSNPESAISIEAGKTISLVSGLGGASIHPANDKAEADWWAKYGDLDNIDYGALFCTFNTNRPGEQQTETNLAKCEFLEISANSPFDTFWLTTPACSLPSLLPPSPTPPPPSTAKRKVMITEDTSIIDSESSTTRRGRDSRRTRQSTDRNSDSRGRRMK